MILKQRTPDDCTICCIATATDNTYEHVMEKALAARLGYEAGVGTRSTLYTMTALGYNARYFQTQHAEAEFPPFDVRALWHRAAILDVPSLNGFKGWHTIYWDGAHLHDPSTGETYPDDLDQLRILGCTLWRANASPASPAVPVEVLERALKQIEAEAADPGWHPQQRNALGYAAKRLREMVEAHRG